MRPLWRWTLYVLAVLLLVLAGLAWWLVQGFDSEHVKRIASDWMRTHHQRELLFDRDIEYRIYRSLPTARVAAPRSSRPSSSTATTSRRSTIR